MTALKREAIDARQLKARKREAGTLKVMKHFPFAFGLAGGFGPELFNLTAIGCATRIRIQSFPPVGLQSTPFTANS